MADRDGTAFASDFYSSLSVFNIRENASRYDAASVTVASGGGTFFPTAAGYMMKSSFLATDDLVADIPAFYTNLGAIVDGTDSVTFTYRKPNNATGSVAGVYDAITKTWKMTISAASYVAGRWVFVATSDAPNTSIQVFSLDWGDYVPETVKTITSKTANLPTDPADASDVAAAISSAQSAITAVLGTPAGASVSADVAAVKADTAAVKTKTDNLPADPAGTSDVTAAVTDIKGASNKDISEIDDKLGTPAGASIAGDIATARAEALVAKKMVTNGWKVQGTQLIIYDDDGTTPYKVFDLKDDSGLPSSSRIFERRPV